ncbi:hypothetical protein Cgig2_013302 [Carnegiea gigantea]|uniref:Uncharacterized protein n=1 Tax=Carnegiea gigantea TaxID=171969 RepID=A0A9Q1GLG2_9CARY|nr:hypothetical protein Cgig2_013302 [Carnegiea gigantea]
MPNALEKPPPPPGVDPASVGQVNGIKILADLPLSNNSEQKSQISSNNEWEVDESLDFISVRNGCRMPGCGTYLLDLHISKNVPYPLNDKIDTYETSNDCLCGFFAQAVQQRGSHAAQRGEKREPRDGLKCLLSRFQIHHDQIPIISERKPASTHTQPSEQRMKDPLKHVNFRRFPKLHPIQLILFPKDQSSDITAQSCPLTPRFPIQSVSIRKNKKLNSFIAGKSMFLFTSRIDPILTN